MLNRKPYIHYLAIVLLIGASLLMSACGSEETAIKDKVEAYNNATSYSMDFTMKTKENNKTVEIVNKVDGNKEYIRFENGEYYQMYRNGINVRYFINEDGLWERKVYDVDEIQSSFVSPDNIKFEWFKEGDGGYYVLEADHYIDMFGESNQGVINIATIRDVEEGLEVYYSYEKSDMTFEYTAVVHSVDSTSVDIPEVQVNNE